MTKPVRLSEECFERAGDPMRVKDVVCGREIELDESVVQAEHGGWLFFFCSGKCHRRFVEMPDRHAAIARAFRRTVPRRAGKI